MSEIAGQLAVHVGAHYLETHSGGRGILLGGAPGIPPAHVVILGAGVVGLWAARIAAGNMAQVTILDKRTDALRRVGELLGRGVVTELAHRAVDRARGRLRRRADRGRPDPRRANVPRGHPRDGRDDEAGLGHRGRLHRPGRMRRDEPADDARRPRLRREGRHALLRPEHDVGGGENRLPRPDRSGCCRPCARSRARGSSPRSPATAASRPESTSIAATSSPRPWRARSASPASGSARSSARRRSGRRSAVGARP